MNSPLSAITTVFPDTVIAPVETIPRYLCPLAVPPTPLPQPLATTSLPSTCGFARSGHFISGIGRSGPFRMFSFAELMYPRLIHGVTRPESFLPFYGRVLFPRMCLRVCVPTHPLMTWGFMTRVAVNIGPHVLVWMCFDFLHCMHRSRIAGSGSNAV